MDDRRRLWPALPVAATLTLLGGCVAARDAATDPAGPEAAAISGLFWFSMTLGVVVWLVVMALLSVPILRSWRRRRSGTDGAPPASSDPPDDRARVRWDVPAGEVDSVLTVADPTRHDEAQTDRRVRGRLVWLGGIALPAVILVTLLVYASLVARATAHTEADDDLVIEVVGHLFWWEVRYPDLDVVTANELHVPVDRRVRLTLTTDDVIHSFWIPRLHGKIDMIPGRTNHLAFTAEQTGRYRGQCAEFCGIAHAQMVAHVVVQEPDEFDRWVAEQRAPSAAPEPGTSAADGAAVFLGSGCAACHSVGGTAAIGGVGPDLTHLASRETLAAGTVPNTRDELRRLIVDPWGVKPGMPMPPTDLSDDELEALLDYLEGLG